MKSPRIIQNYIMESPFWVWQIEFFGEKTQLERGDMKMIIFDPFRICFQNQLPVFYLNLHLYSGYLSIWGNILF